MKINTRTMQISIALFAILLLVAQRGFTQRYSYKENAVPEQVKLSPRLQALFAKTKLFCFGRYTLEVPVEAQLLMGEIGVPPTIEVFDGGMEARNQRIAEDISQIKSKRETAEIRYNGEGPIAESWQIRYFYDEFAKKYNKLYFKTYVNKGELTFVIGGSIHDENDTEETAIVRQAKLAKRLRLRTEDEVPDEPGFCIEQGFVADDIYGGQETADAGIFIPSLPDITFSISSNKDAYGDYTPLEFDQQRAELSLLNRIAAAQKEQGLSYPSRTVFREGKRDVQHWHGEESMFVRGDGVHDFEWALVGTPENVANPSVLRAVMFSKVAHNTVGAAKGVSITDDEAVALWDKLLSGLKFRVKVPGAPEGSYFIDAKKPVSGQDKDKT